MIIFTDPTNGDQVMAVYDGCETTSTVWADQGFVRHEIADDASVCKEVRSMQRECCVEIRGGQIASAVAAINPIQLEPPVRSPSISPELAALREKLQADTITDAELRAMLRLERGLD
jgi:hypothetical protein